MQALSLIESVLPAQPAEVPPAALTTMTGICPSCQDTGWEKVAGKGVRPCLACRTKKNANLTVQDTRIPMRYADCTIENYLPVGSSQDTGHIAQKKAREAAERLIKGFPASPRGLLFIGPCGVGKTHLAVATALALQAKGAWVRFYDFRELLKLIQESYNPEERTSEWQILAPVRNAEVLVLDEIGAARPTDWALDTMTQIINHRYNDCRLTIFTSNFSDTPSQAHPYTLTDRVGPRIRSRLHQMCHTFEITGTDYRATNAE